MGGKEKGSEGKGSGRGKLEVEEAGKDGRGEKEFKMHI